MNLLDLATQRRACHQFEVGYKIENKDFLKILEPVRFTPSGYNAQPWKFQLVRDNAVLQKIYSIAFKQQHILDAGNLVIVRGDREFGEYECERILAEWEQYRGFSTDQLQALRASLRKERPEPQKREMVLRNCALAAMSFLISATEQGFATCPMMGFSQKKLATILDFPPTHIPILLIALGKASKTQAIDPPFPRKTAEEIAIID